MKSISLWHSATDFMTEPDDIQFMNPNMVAFLNGFVNGVEKFEADEVGDKRVSVGIEEEVPGAAGILDWSAREMLRSGSWVG
jgi:hypothetical protein